VILIAEAVLLALGNPIMNEAQLRPMPPAEYKLSPQLSSHFLKNVLLKLYVPSVLPAWIDRIC